MLALILITLLSVASVFSSHMTHECMEEIQQKYAHHLAMSRDEARDHMAIMKMVMQQIDFSKCKNVQIRIKINDDKPESGNQNGPKTIREPDPRNEERNENSYKVKYKDELKEDRDQYILNVQEEQEPYERRAQYKNNLEQNDSSIKEAQQIYSSTQRNIQYKEDKNNSMDVKPTDNYEEYDYEIYNENTEIADYRNSKQPPVTQRESNSNHYIDSQLYKPQYESNIRSYNNKRQPQNNQPELNNYYRNRRLYSQPYSNTDYYKSSRSNDKKTDVSQEPTKFINKNGSGVNQYYYDYENEEVIKDVAEAEKTRVHDSNTMNKYNSRQHYAENTTIVHDSSTEKNIQRKSNTHYYDSNISNISYDKASENYRNDKKISVTKGRTDFKNENSSRDDQFYYDYESEEVVKDDIGAKKTKVHKGNMMDKYYNSFDNVEYTNTNHETSTVMDGEKPTYSNDVNSKYRNRHKPETTIVDYIHPKEAIDRTTDSYIDQDANEYYQKQKRFEQIETEKRSDKTSNSNNEDNQFKDYEKHTENLEDDEDIDYFERNKDIFFDQSRESYSDKEHKLSKPRGMKNNDTWHIVHYPTENGITSSGETPSQEIEREIIFGEHKDISVIQKPDTAVNNQNQYYEETKTSSVHFDELKKKNASPGDKNENSESDTTSVQYMTKENSTEQSSENTSTVSKMNQVTLSEVKQDKTIIEDQTETVSLDKKQNIVSSDIQKPNNNLEDNDSSETNEKKSKQTDSNVVQTQSNDYQTEDESSVLFSKEFSIMNNPISLVIKRHDTGDGNPDESSSVDVIFQIINSTWQTLESIINSFFQSGG